ncbi:aluminum-activated malate transporter 7-like [Lotus japonicus]|uniref:aluminum-activated malate transporter 7-like n=1 Tax=Lotus japonicus TaxID=34305 RepID=UPI00258265EC|nr:aluminum-activated malate transporter 7-like [Lotus japonicus]
MTYGLRRGRSGDQSVAGANFTKVSLLERFDDGLLLFIVTFTLAFFPRESHVKTFTLTYQRLVPILIGIAACVAISLVVFPVWTCEELNKLIASNIEQLVYYLEGIFDPVLSSHAYICVSQANICMTQMIEKYLRSREDIKVFLILHHSTFSFFGMIQDLILCISQHLQANFAGWELSYVGFRLCYPWKQYLKIGALVRECAYKICTLENYLNSKIESLIEVFKLESSCIKICFESNKALKELSSSIKTMADSSAAKIHIENSKAATE